MQIEIKLDESCKEPNIIIHTDKMTEEVSQIVKLLSEEKPEVFAAIHENGEIILLEQTDLCRKRPGICKDKRRQLPVKGKTV